MWDWFRDRLERSQRRAMDLERGVDANLLRDNKKKWRIGWSLLACVFLFGWILAEANLSPVLHGIVSGLLIATMVGSIFMLHWARAEYGFLVQPEPRKPPTIWKWR